jgi:hypothetical protein
MPNNPLFHFLQHANLLKPPEIMYKDAPFELLLIS